MSIQGDLAGRGVRGLAAAIWPVEWDMCERASAAVRAPPCPWPKLRASVPRARRRLRSAMIRRVGARGPGNAGLPNAAYGKTAGRETVG
jgi:hypothetical protein